MSKCVKCGHALSEGQKFCNMCGTKVETCDTKCPNCGQRIMHGQKFCTACGAKVEPSTVTSSKRGDDIPFNAPIKNKSGGSSRFLAVVLIALIVLTVIIMPFSLNRENIFSGSSTTKSTTRSTTRTTTTTSATAEDHSFDNTVYWEDNYKVGVDIPAGTYVLLSTSSYSGYMCISSDANQDDIIENDNFEEQVYIEIKSGQYLDLSRCYAISADTAPKAETNWDGCLTNGMYKVGYDLPAGEYKLSATSDYGGYYAIYDGPLGTGKIKSNDNFEKSKYVTVKKGQYLYLSRAEVKIEE